MLRTTLAAVSFAIWASAAFAQTPSPEPSVVVTQGQASLKRAPDQAWVSIAAETRASRPAEAQRLGAAAMTAVQAALKTIGVATDAIKTTSYSLQPDMEYVGGSSRVRGYIARNQIEVRVDALEKLGDVLDAVGSSGATSIAGLRFDIKDRDALEREALRLSVRNAMARAEAMAAGAGRTLGQIIRVEEQGTATPRPLEYMTLARASPGAATPTPISPSEIEITARVTLTVAIR